MSRHATIAANRARMPGTAREVDAWRQVFGPDVRLIHAIDDCLEVGKPTVPIRSMDADQWIHFLHTGTLPAEEGDRG